MNLKNPRTVWWGRTTCPEYRNGSKNVFVASWQRSRKKEYTIHIYALLHSAISNFFHFQIRVKDAQLKSTRCFLESQRAEREEDVQEIDVLSESLRLERRKFQDFHQQNEQLKIEVYALGLRNYASLEFFNSFQTWPLGKYKCKEVWVSFLEC